MLLLGLFFILIGMSIDLAALAAGWPWILAQVVVLVSLKAVILLGLCRMFGLALPAALRTSLLLVQGGEFGFVLFSAARAAAIMDPGFSTPRCSWSSRPRWHSPRSWSDWATGLRRAWPRRSSCGSPRRSGRGPRRSSSATAGSAGS